MKLPDNNYYKQMRKDLKELLEYIEPYEYEHYQLVSSKEKKNHIYKVIKRLGEVL